METYGGLLFDRGMIRADRSTTCPPDGVLAKDRMVSRFILSGSCSPACGTAGRRPSCSSNPRPSSGGSGPASSSSGPGRAAGTDQAARVSLRRSERSSDKCLAPTSSGARPGFIYYHGARTHLALDKDAPEPRPIERLDDPALVETPMVGGLHHRYTRQAA
jgi:hypothetical protein